MKNIIFSLALLLGNMTFITAQDFYLPVSSTSETAKTAYYKASEALSNYNVKVADEQINIALEADPSFFMVYVLKTYYVDEKQQAELIDKILAIDSRNFNQAEKITRQLFVKWDKDPKAKTGNTSKDLVAAYPNTPEAYEWATFYTGLIDGDIDGAYDYALKLAELSPTYAPAYNNLGYAYMGEKQMDKAKAAFEKYIELAPNEANAYDSMGEYYMIVKDYKNSAKYYDKAFALGLESAKERAEKARATMKQ